MELYARENVIDSSGGPGAPPVVVAAAPADKQPGAAGAGTDSKPGSRAGRAGSSGSSSSGAAGKAGSGKGGAAGKGTPEKEAAAGAEAGAGAGAAGAGAGSAAAAGGGGGGGVAGLAAKVPALELLVGGGLWDGMGSLWLLASRQEGCVRSLALPCVAETRRFVLTPLGA